MSKHLYDGWCEIKLQAVKGGGRLHSISEIAGARAKQKTRIISTVLGHYEDPLHLAERAKRVGLKRAAKVLAAFLPKSKKARSGHIGEILATEVVPAILPDFLVPISRLRWLDGRETALRGEDVIGVARKAGHVRFLKTESKSRVSLSPGVVAAARQALNANKGRPSQHAMGFIMHRLTELGQSDLSQLFENYLLAKTIADEDIVHMFFGLAGNDASAAVRVDLEACSGRIEQHAVTFHIPDHPNFIASLYQP
ncbi:MAG: hypothetical protein ABSG96_25110 [Terracidiphilus sp.]